MLLSGGGLSGCRPADAAEPPQTQEPSPTERLVEIAAPTATIEAAGQAGEMASVEAEPDYCLDCHTDQQRLMDTAAPVEKKPSENKGEG